MKEMKTILMATDFSPVAENAAWYAADMALMINADLFLFNSFQISVVYAEVPLAMNLTEMQKDAEKLLDKLKDELETRTNGKLNIKTKVSVGNFYAELENLCEFLDPYAVVMGSQGTTAAERVLFGGHTIHAMKHLAWSLITVPPNAMFTSINNIGLAYDFDTALDKEQINELKTIVKDFNAKLHVLNIGKEATYNPEIVFESSILREMLDPIEPLYHFISNRNTNEGIIDYADKHEIDLLVVIPKKHSLLDTLIHKSHTKQFVLHSHVPVMSLHDN
jgi:nucleotide-binding universal stress UspA family protein